MVFGKAIDEVRMKFTVYYDEVHSKELVVDARDKEDALDQVVFLLSNHKWEEGVDFAIDHAALYRPAVSEVRHCPHDGLKCNHDCEGDECWRVRRGVRWEQGWVIWFHTLRGE